MALTRAARPTAVAVAGIASGAAGPRHALHRLQRAAGNAAVSSLLAPGPVTAQRSVDEVHTLIHGFQGRLGRGPGANASALAIAREFAGFADRATGHDDETRAEIRVRALMILTDLRAAGLNPGTSTQVTELLNPLRTTGGRALPVVVKAATRAVDVLKALEAGTASVTGLQTKWFVTSDDSGGGYSTAYNVGATSAWEIHVHRTAKGTARICTVQSAHSVGNKNATRAMPLADAGKLAAIGVPAIHPKKGEKNRWGPL